MPYKMWHYFASPVAKVSASQFLQRGVGFVFNTAGIYTSPFFLIKDTNLSPIRQEHPQNTQLFRSIYMLMLHVLSISSPGSDILLACSLVSMCQISMNLTYYRRIVFNLIKKKVAQSKNKLIPLLLNSTYIYIRL